jgi:hypothetical protein
VAEFLEDTATVSADVRELATICSATTSWGVAAQLRTHVLTLPAHHRHAVFKHLLKLMPLDALLTSCPFDFLQPVADALVRDGGAQADGEPASDQDTSTPARRALHLPAPAPGKHPQYGATALTPAAYTNLFMQFPMLPQLTAVSLVGQQLGNKGVLAASMALQVHPNWRTSICAITRWTRSACVRWPRLCSAGRSCARCCCPATSC